MNRDTIQKFIIYIFLFVSAVSIAGTGLDGAHQIRMTQAADDVMQCFVESELLPDDSVGNIKVMEPGSMLIRAQQMRTQCSEFSYQSALYFLCALAFLSGLFLFTNRERFALYGNRYVSRIGYQVVYMEDEDGRKRIS